MSDYSEMVKNEGDTPFGAFAMLVFTAFHVGMKIKIETDQTNNEDIQAAFSVLHEYFTCPSDRIDLKFKPGLDHR